MERRKEPRFGVNALVNVTILDPAEGEAIPGRVLDMSGNGLRLIVPSLIASGSPVKVETSEILMLGEVCRCEQVDQGYEVGMVLSETLAGLADLQQLNRALMQQDASKLVEAPTRS